MDKGEHKTTLVGETVFVLQCYFPPEKSTLKAYRPVGKWTTCYSWVYACGEEEVRMSISDATRKRLDALKKKAQGYTGKAGALNLHHDGLAYRERADAHAALALIRKWKCCKYKCRVMRETVWKEEVIDDYPKEPLLPPFYWPPTASVPTGVVTDPEAMLRTHLPTPGVK